MKALSFTLTLYTRSIIPLPLPLYPYSYTLTLDGHQNKKDAQESISPLRVPNGGVAAQLLRKHIVFRCFSFDTEYIPVASFVYMRNKAIHFGCSRCNCFCLTRDFGHDSIHRRRIGMF